MMKKNNVITIISILVGAVLIVSTFLIIHNYNNSKRMTVSELYGVVKQVNNDSIVVEDPNTNKVKTFLVSDGNFTVGDLVSIKTKGDKIEESKVIVEGYSSITTSPIIVVEPTTTENTTTTEVVTTQSVVTTTKERTTSIASPNTKITTTTRPTTTKSVVDKDTEILNYFENQNVAVSRGDKSTSFKDKAKSGFITIVDFIFYGGKIKGITFKELKSSTKSKVIYYALLIDNGIDSLFPGYKESLAEKYKTAKGRLVAEFLDLKYEMCTRSEDGCAQASEDLKLLKYSLNLTWDMIKSFFIYVKNLTVPKIQSWYESFRG